jgi:UDP-GlcNAc:undecaprenyl-phosphate/decaprenyl-phosphate GlcNAc-1-phosphate transferase
MLEYRGYLAVAIALVSALVLTPLVRTLARRAGKVSRPRSDRWAKKPTALLGGLAIFTATVGAGLLVLPDVSGGWLILGGSTFLFAVGLVDDLRPLKPYQKLLGQLVGCVLVLAAGPTLPWTPFYPLNLAVTLFWLVGITNALNLLDNMDGLSAGVAAIAAVFLSAAFFLSNQAAEGYLLAAFGAALLGFLVYNFNPASIFMGDCGSLFIGFFLAATTLRYVSSDGGPRDLPAALAVPVFLLFVPIFDTTLVTVIRKLSGRPISQGGRDHTSHRLVALGLTERGAVVLLYGLAAVSGVLALLVRYVGAAASLGLLGGFVLLHLLLGLYLARVKVYEKGLPSEKQPSLPSN